MTENEIIYEFKKALIKRLNELKETELKNLLKAPNHRFKSQKSRLDMVYEIISLITEFSYICSNHEQHRCKSISDGDTNLSKSKVS